MDAAVVSNLNYSVLQDTCPHRRAPLSTGKVVRPISGSESSESSLACRYHGWEFDAKGSCTKIPMQLPPTSESSGGPSSRIRVLSYPVREAGGLLWVFMDPFYLSSSSTNTLPEIPEESVMSQDEFNSSAGIWIHSAWPISYLSMLENSLDPSHAPFVHEGFGAPGGMTYSPDNAQPMQIYRVTTPMTVTDGFALEHSPYLKSKLPVNATAPPLMTVRRFLPPCTNIFSSPPFFSGRLYFVPNTATTTTTIGFMKLPSTPTTKSKPLDFLQKRLLPPAWRTTLANWRHVSGLMAEGQDQFGKQDMWTMQGQDERKLADLRRQHQDIHDQSRIGGRRSSWDDMVVTPSDTGVATLQRWMKKFGNGGPFPLHNLLSNPTPATSSSAHAVRPMSLWESRGKFCPQCRAVRRQAAWLEQRLGQASTVSLALSVLGALYSTLVATNRGMAIMRSSLSLVYTTSLVSVVLSVTFRTLSERCRRIQQRFFRTGDSGGRNQILELTYQYDS